MERWRGKVAIVTGASMGIGAAIAIRLIREGVTVVGIARRVELIEALRDKVADPTRLHALKCDLTQEADIRMAFEYVERELGGIDILVNNAASGNSGMHYVDEDNANDLRQILETNVLGLVLCTREAFQSMRRRGVDGHVVMLGSICGRIVPKLPELGAMNMYVASKYAVTAIAEQIRQEFHELGTQIKISVREYGIHFYIFCAYFYDCI